MLNLKTLIKTHEDWLIDRVLLYAQQKSYTKNSSTLREAWRNSIRGLSAPLIQFSDAARLPNFSHTAAIKDATKFGVAQALQHRAQGVDVLDFVGALKIHRDAFLDLIREKEPDGDEREPLRDLILELFDSIEVGLLAAWGTTSATDQLVELQTRNRELTNEKNKYLTVFESIAEPAILLDLENSPTHVNAAAHRLLLGEDDPGAGYYGDLSNPLLHVIVRKLLSSSEASSDPVSLYTPHGERLFDVSVQQMLDISEKFSGSVIILQDITDYLNAIKAAEAADHAKSVFLNTITHEIRTPLNGILGLTRLMEDAELPASKVPQLRSIQASGEMLSAVIENVLGLSKAQADALQLVKQDFHLGTICDALYQVLELVEGTQQPRLMRDIAADVPMHLHGDGHKLRHVLLNLLSNALKYAGEGPVTLVVTSECVLEDGRHQLRFEVVDTGPGVPENAVDTLFEPFSQAGQNSPSASGGSGLGLAICKHLVEFLGGEIAYRPNPAGGSIFGFSIAVEVAKDQKPQTRGASDCRVLVIEDDPVNATVVEAYLEELGNHVTLARSYPEAETALANPDFDIVITDYRLGQNTGLDVVDALRVAERKSGRSIPIVVMTAAIPANSHEQIQQLGIDLFLEKPFSRYELANALSGVRREEESNSASEHSNAPQGIRRQDLNQLLSDLGFSRCQKVVHSFQSTLPNLLAGMRACEQKGDINGIRELAHQLIGASGFIGARRLVDLAKALKIQCKNNDMEKASKTLEDLHSEGELVLQALEADWPKQGDRRDSDQV
ncbi:ATP-binding protein [Vannielia sp.]|uniref:ATP-binding protein n=1 Tax=Vannielia sp. TaxID=2813045 RepID=UPI002623DE48|nr:ATP-binding protein [Vannielia sp.]MDF1872846.1 ATP-binding protein [Vannielia sp.]